jgi:alpha-1,2-mannosyltransferase
MSQPNPFPPHTNAQDDRLKTWQRLGLWALAATFLAFGFLAELRGAFLQRPMTDVQVYLRAAWAARAGEDIYTITDDNHWHYHYPPLLAILSAPLADAPRGADRTGLLPFAVSVGVWYWFSVVCLVAGLHVLASAIEPGAVRGGRRWWVLRVGPLVACLTPVVATLMRGQVNLFLLAMLCFAGAAVLRGRSWRTGAWIAAAVCLKVYPAFLLVYPLWRRDYRCLAGCAAGLLVGLVLIPMAWFGPARTVEYYSEWSQVLMRPALGTGDDHARDYELIRATATESQSLGSMLHNTMYFDRLTRPGQHALWVRVAHWLIGALLTVVTLLAAGYRRDGHPLQPILLLGALTLIMLMLSPVCHLHYFCLAAPLVMGLMGREWEEYGTARLSWGLTVVLIANFVLNALTHLPSSDVARDLGFASYGALLLWGVAIVKMWRMRASPETQARLLPVRSPASVEEVSQLPKAS